MERMEQSMRLLCAILLAATLAACAATQPSMQVRADRNPAASFATYRTYAWATMPERAPQWPAHDDRVSFDWSVRGLVDQQMARLGYQQVGADRADLLLDYAVSTREQTMNDTFGSYAAYRAQGGTASAGEAWVMGYEKGTLVVEATDPRLRTLVWYGSASAVVNPKLRAQRLPKAIEQVFQSFPARPAP
jgi:hypothetical protein